MIDLNSTVFSMPFYRRLSDSQVQALHEATLEILERTGVRFSHEGALSIFRHAGVSISDGDRVRIPARLVDWALRSAPKQIILYDQLGQAKIRLSGRKVYFGNGSDLLDIIDHRTGHHRKPVLQDVVEGVRLLDTLPRYDFVMSFVLPHDVPVDTAERHQMRVMLENTTKPLVYVTTEAIHTRAAVAMAEALAGGDQALRERPFAVNYINIADPKRHNWESVEKLLLLAEKGLPAIYRPSIVTRGISTPITVAGFLCTNNAAQLAGLVLAQLKREGAPFIRCSHGGGTFDMRLTVGQHAAPEARGFQADLAHYYGLPCFGIGGVSGSKTVDQQAALEAALTLLEAALGGSQLIHDVGYLNNGMTGSLEQLMICHEIIGWIKHYLPGLTVDADNLALDLIDEIGPDGHFLETEHTLRHLRDDWYPDYLDRQQLDAWVAEGSLDLRERVRCRIDDLLGESRPPTIPNRVQDHWEAIVQGDLPLAAEGTRLRG